MKILDLSAGNRAIWHNKNHPEATYLDKRESVNPTIVCDTRSIPESAGSGYDLIVWDPPHMNCGPNSNMSKCYGYHTTAEILDTIEKTAREAFRVSTDKVVMALKWNNHDISLQRVYDLMPQWEPLFGHLTKDGPRSQTFWVLLKKKPPLHNHAESNEASAKHPPRDAEPVERPIGSGSAQANPTGETQILYNCGVSASKEDRLKAALELIELFKTPRVLPIIGTIERK